MSDKKDDSNELDRYGVWVKNSPLDINDESSNSSDNAVEEFELPDFDESALDDFSSDSQNDSLDDGETSLNPDELANIVMEAEPAPEEEITQNEGITDEETAALSGAFFSDDSDLPEEDSLDDANFETGEIEPEKIEVAEEIPPEPEPVAETKSEETEISFEDGEIDLGSFMGDSDGSQEISFEDGEIDLDDFMGGDFSSSGPSKEPAEINDEQTLEINVDFDKDAETIALEDTPENEAKMNPPAAPSETTTQGGTDDEMFSSFDAAVAAQGIPESAPDSGAAPQASSSSDEIDLSEFGFDDDDSKIGMTEGPDGSNPIKKEVVNYVMKVTADGDTETPSVKDVIYGKISADSNETDSEEDYITNTMENTTENAVSPEISEKGKEILEEIMTQLSSLRDEIKNIKAEFADIQSRSTEPAAPAAQEIPQAAAPSEEASEDDDSEGFFGSDDGDDTIALSGSEMTDILNSVEITQAEESSDALTEAEPEGEPQIESDSIEEPQVEENIEQEMEETSISEDELGIPDPTLEGLSDDYIMPTPNSTEVQGELSLPNEISVPTSGAFNDEAVDDYMSEDISIENSLTEENLSYLEENAQDSQENAPNVNEIMQDNISLKEGDEASIEIADDTNAAFEEADATESDILDDSLAAKDNFENSVSGIIKENISNQEDEEASVGIESDINAAFEEADATESDILDDSLAKKDAYEQEINKNIDDEQGPVEFEEPVIEDAPAEEPSIAETLEEPAEETIAITEELPTAEESQVQESGDDIEAPAEFEEPVIEDAPAEETIAETPSVAKPLEEEAEETSVEEPTIAAADSDANENAQQSSIPKNLREEVISVLSYMDQLLENLPEEKITEFAKSEHFATYKKLFDELGLS